MSMDQYAAQFTANGVDGLQLLNLDNNKLKVGLFYRESRTMF